MERHACGTMSFSLSLSLSLPLWVLGVVAAVGLFACETVPVTGRQQLILMYLAEENRLGITAYEQILKEEGLSRDPQFNAMVNRVGQRIAAGAERTDYAWEFRVIDKDVANAFALPGGKVAVYTGILQYTPTDAALAVVMGHEVAHALARHGSERMSRSMVVQLGLAAVQIGLGTSDPAIVQGIGLAYGLGVELPFDRGQEAEADHIWLTLMAKAGYDPREAIPFWQRMEAGQQGQAAGRLCRRHDIGRDMGYTRGHTMEG